MKPRRVPNRKEVEAAEALVKIREPAADTETPLPPNLTVSNSNYSGKDEFLTNQKGRSIPLVFHSAILPQSPSDTKHLLPHFSIRNFTPLGIPSDKHWLSPFFTFVRFNCTEVVPATAKDVAYRRESRRIVLGQVGIRCRFCAHREHRDRANRSCCYPSTVSRIYQSLTMMVREHFLFCSEMPIGVKNTYTSLKALSVRGGSTASKAYWEDSARELRLTQVENKNGIFLTHRLPTIPGASASHI